MNPFPFLPNQLIVGNSDSPVAVCCGWTPREMVLRRLQQDDPNILDKIACIGQLYTAERGIDMMVRNLLAVPSIKRVILTGQDRTGAQTALYRLMLNPAGLQPRGDFWELPNSNLKIGKDIPLEALLHLKESAYFVLPGPTLPSAAAIVVPGLESMQARVKTLFPPVRKEPDDFPGPDNAHVLRGKTVGDVYLKILYNIMTFGRRIHTHYDQDSKEIMNLVAVITAEDPKISVLPPFVPFSADHLEKYRAKLLSPDKDPNVTYTYGNRMRLHFGVDQIAEVVAKMTREPVTRSAVISLWDPGKEGGGSPCLNHLWFRIRDGRLHMTATIRSNDMFFGWPENAYGLRHLQENVRERYMLESGAFCEDGRLTLGDLVINSQSAHIYEDCWAPATDIIKEHYRPEPWWDEKGQWTFDRNEATGEITAELFKDGQFVRRIIGSATFIRKEIAARNLVSDVGHALYVGAMLEKLNREEKK